MEPRHSQQGTPESQTTGFDRLLREGKHESLNRAKETLKRRLLQSLLQQVLDDLSDADSAADAALEGLAANEAVLEKARAALKARLMQQLMAEAIEEIGEETQDGFDDEIFADEDLLADDESEAKNDQVGGQDDDTWNWKSAFDDTAKTEAAEGSEDEAATEASEKTETIQPAEEWSLTQEAELPELIETETSDFLDDSEDDRSGDEGFPDEFVESDKEEVRPFFDVEEDLEESSPWSVGHDLTMEEADASFKTIDSDSGADGATFRIDKDPALSFDDDFNAAEEDIRAQGASSMDESVTFDSFESFEESSTFLHDDAWGTEKSEQNDRIKEGVDVGDETFLSSDFDTTLDSALEESDPYLDNSPGTPAAHSFNWDDTADAGVGVSDEALGYYVYAVLSNEEILPVDLSSVAGIDPEYPVYTVEHEGLRALVSHVPLEQFGEPLLEDHMQDEEWVDSHVRAHESILEQFMAHVPLVPMRFGSVYPSQDALLYMLAQRESQFKSTLERLHGHQEWDIQIYSDVEHLRRWVMEESEKVRGLLNDIKTKPKDVAPDIKRQMVQAIHEGVHAETEACIQACHEAYSQHAEESRMHSARGSAEQGEQVFRAVYLVHKSEEGALQDTFDRVRNAYEPYGFHFELQGPWRPFIEAEALPNDPTEHLEDNRFD